MDWCEIFNANELKITIEANKRIIDFLDISLDLNNHSIAPYSKPNNTLNYVNKQSNHPPTVLKNIPCSIDKRLSNNSSDITIFNNATPQYQTALTNAGCNHQLKYEEHQQETTLGRVRQMTLGDL